MNLMRYAMKHWMIRMAGRLAAVTAMLAGVQAETPKPPPAAFSAANAVIVPYDGSKPIKGQQPDQVYVPYARFLQLWEAAKAKRAPVAAPVSPLNFSLNSALYEARLEKQQIVIRATIQLTTFNAEWVKVPLPFDTVLGGMTLDGKSVSLDAEQQLLVATPGVHTLVVEMTKALEEESAEQFSWQVPPTAATRVVLTLPDDRRTASFEPDAGVVEETGDGKKTLVAAMGSTRKVTVQLRAVAAAARADQEPASAKLVTLLAVHPSYEAIQLRARIMHRGQSRDRYTIKAPKGLNLTMINAANLRGWKLTQTEQQQELEIQLMEPEEDEGVFDVHWERPVQAPAEVAVPQFSSGTRRDERSLVLVRAAGATVTARPEGGLRQFEPDGLLKTEEMGLQAGQALIGAWNGSGALRYQVDLTRSRYEATMEAVYQVNRRKVELIASLQLAALEGQLDEVGMTIPAGFEVLTVTSARLQDWWQEGAQLRVRLRGETPASTPLVVHLVRDYPAAPQALEIQPLTLPGYGKVTGEAVIAAHKGINVALQLKERSEAREVDATAAAKSFRILAPMERKRGFKFSGQAFSGQVALTALPPKLEAAWILHAEAHEVWVSLSMKTQLTVRQGSIDTTTFSLPAALPEARVSGKEIRETRSRIADGQRIYDVQFHHDIDDQVDFTVDLDAPIQGPFALPAPLFPSAQLVTGYVVADNASEYEMQLKSDGVSPVPVSDLPWKPEVTKSAGVFRTQPGWAVTLSVDKLEKTEARTAYCAWADLTTALRTDGTEWHRAVWRLQNRSLQFLPVALPEGAELMSARVAGRVVRADTGVVDGRKAVLIPLIRTKPGDISYDVEVVWRRTSGPLVLAGHRKFDDAELIGITVEQTFWSMWVPDAQPVSGVESNMTEVIQVAQEVEKGRASLEELKALNKLLQSGELDPMARQAAQRNFDLTCAALNEQVVGNKAKLSVANSLAVDGGSPRDTQRRNQVSDLIVANGYVDDELQKAVSDNRLLQQQTPQAEASAAQILIPMPAQPNQSIEDLGNRYAVIAKQQSPVGNTNMQAAQIYNADSNLDRSGKWSMNEPVARLNQAKKKEAQTGKDNLYVNDNVALDVLVEATPPVPAPVTAPKAPKSKADSTGLSGKGLGVSQGKVANQMISGPVPAEQAGAKASPDANFRQRSYSRAVQQEDGTKAMAAPEKPTSTTSVTAPGLAALPNSAAPMPPSTPLAFTGNVSGATALGAPQNGGQVQSLFTTSGTLQLESAARSTDGRIALMIDFPTEGRVYHFQKVKANAELEVALGSAPGSIRWGMVGIFGLLGLVLAATPMAIQTVRERTRRFSRPVLS